MRMKHLYLADLSEQSFPVIDRGGALISRDELIALSRVQIGVPGDATEASPFQSEMLLFYELINRPTERLTFSYTALDEKAQPLLSSPFLGEVLALYPEESALPVTRPRLGPIPEVAFPRSLTEWRLKALGEALSSQSTTPLLTGVWSHEGFPCRESLEAGLRTVAGRGRGSEFGEYEGVFTAGPILQDLDSQFGHSHLWSASQLETYATCPFKFFAANVLGCRPLNRLALETDHASRGTTFHETMARFYHETADQDANEDDEVLAKITQILEEVTASARDYGKLPAIREIERRQIAEWLEDYQGQVEKYEELSQSFEEPLHPKFLEIRFGPAQDAEDDEEDPFEDDASHHEPLSLVLGDLTIRITGRIDRVDAGRLSGHLFFSIVDFKTGSPNYLKPLSANSVSDGTSFQIPIYIKAAAQLFDQQGIEAFPWHGGYWAIREKGFIRDKSKGAFQSLTEVKGGSVKPSEAWLEIEAALEQRLPAIVRGIRLGHFPMINDDEHCTARCDFRTVCRVATARSLQKHRPEIP